VKSRETARRVHLFRNGRNQAVRIPRDFELPGDEALLRRDGTTGRLILEPVYRRDILEIIAGWEPLPPGEQMPSLEDLPADPVDL